ncbi:hypothetical protein A4R35_22580 [Thermogemmatispora tikiterensis]|uniref:Uncharacterized protein n=1 Tax=Thermogemmatispora tikiterensis TaxID=1825093 RepID=A0A328VST9_9CHLR|nr:hypothetical protein A4R35_22580 [Thermogemmatispora tikiterensis]
MAREGREQEQIRCGAVRKERGQRSLERKGKGNLFFSWRSLLGQGRGGETGSSPIFRVVLISCYQKGFCSVLFTKGAGEGAGFDGEEPHTGRNLGAPQETRQARFFQKELLKARV